MRWDLQNEKHVAKIRKRILCAYKKISQSENGWEDCAQEILCRWIAGKNQKQTIDFAVIDYLRERSGRRGSPGYSQRQNLINASSYEKGSFDNFIGRNNGMSLEDRNDVERIIGMSRHWERAIMSLAFREGYGQAEIGNFFGVSESRVSQWLKRIQKRISTRIKIEESRVENQRKPQVERILPEKESRIEWRLESFEDHGLAKSESRSVASFNAASF